MKSVAGIWLTVCFTTNQGSMEEVNQALTLSVSASVLFFSFFLKSQKKKKNDKINNCGIM